MRYLDLKERKFHIVKDVQSKGHVNFCKVAYHFLRISEKECERFKEQYIVITIHHHLIMQHEIFGYQKEKKVNSGKNVQSKVPVNYCKVTYHLLETLESGLKDLRTTVPLVSYIRSSLRFWYYASLSTCCQNLEKN